MNEQKKIDMGVLWYMMVAGFVCMYPALSISSFYPQHKICLLLIVVSTTWLCLLLSHASKQTWLMSGSLAVGVYLIALLLDVLTAQMDVSLFVFISIHHTCFILLTTICDYVRKGIRYLNHCYRKARQEELDARIRAWMDNHS